jgi:predicted protein tyrosine phosphatase
MAFLMLKDPRGTGPREHKFLTDSVKKAPIVSAHFKEPCHFVHTQILVGSINAASPDVIAEKRITHIVNPLGEGEDGRFKMLKEEHGVRFFTTSFNDNSSVQIGRYFKAVNAWIAEAVAASPDHNVLVMCAAGVSRSCALAQSFLMERRGLRVIDAFITIQAKRTICDPNPGFRKDLVSFDAHLYEGGKWEYDGLSLADLDATADDPIIIVSSNTASTATPPISSSSAVEADQIVAGLAKKLEDVSIGGAATTPAVAVESTPTSASSTSATTTSSSTTAPAGGEAAISAPA